MKDKYKGIDDEIVDDIPQWHKETVLKRLQQYNDNEKQALDFDKVMDEIDKEL